MDDSGKPVSHFDEQLVAWRKRSIRWAVRALALLAVVRKVIELDYKETGPDYIYATAALVLALSVA